MAACGAAQQSVHQWWAGFIVLLRAFTVPLVAAFRKGLSESGFTEHQNVSIEYRYANGQYERLSALAGELARRPVDVIFAGAPPAALAAKDCDDDHTHHLRSWPRSGRRRAGAKFQPTRRQCNRNHYGHGATCAKAFGNIARASAQGSQRCDACQSDTRQMLVPELRDVQAAAQVNGFKIVTVNATTAAELDQAFKGLADNRPDALLIGSDPFFVARSEQFATFASQAKIPAIYPFRESADAGGLISYGTNIPNAYRQGGI